MGIAEYFRKIVEANSKTNYPKYLLNVGSWKIDQVILDNLFGIKADRAWGAWGDYLQQRKENFAWKKSIKDKKFNPECIIAEHENLFGYAFIMKSKRTHYCFIMLKSIVTNNFGNTYPSRLMRLDAGDFIREFGSNLVIHNEDEFSAISSKIALENLEKGK